MDHYGGHHRDLAELEVVAAPWAAHDEAVAASGFWSMARRLPVVFGRVVRECWGVSRFDTSVLVAGTVVAEVFTAVGLLATTGVLEGLLSAGPTPERVRAALPALVVIIVAITLRGALKQLVGWSRERLVPQIRLAVEARLMETVTRVELVAFDDGGFSDTLHRVRYRAPDSVQGLLFTGLQIVSSVIGLVAVAGVLTVLHPVLLLALLPTWWASVRSARLSYALYAGLGGAERRKQTLSELMTDRTAAAEVRAYTMRPFLLGQFYRLAHYVRAENLRLERRQMVNRGIGDALGGLGTAAVFAVLGLLLYRGAMPLAVAGTALVAIRAALGALAGIGSSMNWSYETALFYQDYEDFLVSAAARHERAGGAPPPADLDRITVRDVSFTYPSAAEPALRGVSIDVRPGEVIALVGANGSGKSTLAKILSGLYRPERGTVSYGGTPLDELDLDLLRDRIAVIAQDFTHWPLSARENITIGRHDHPESEAQLAKAAASSGADGVLAGLPKGADTLLDPSYRGGTELSGGQWQRIAVARGLYRDAALLICDEPTAALDARTEHAIFETIRRHAAQRTVVLITHRLASVRYADRVYVLEQGRVAEHGTHAELMAERGIYHEFYTLQAQAYQDPAPEPTA